MLKIKSEHYATIETAMKTVLQSVPNVREEYTNAGYSNMRLNWDVFRYARIDGDSIKWVCDNLYSYLNDSHVNNALAKIMGNDGLDTKGKKR